jgi:hypothetical protein
MVPSTSRIDKIYVEEGDRVSRGISFSDGSNPALPLAATCQSEKDLSRLDTLLKAGSAKQQAYDQMKTQYDVLKTNVEFMEQNTLMNAPFTGVITGKYFENGEMYPNTLPQ